MTDTNLFKNAIHEAEREFKARLEQQRLFQAQNLFLVKLYEVLKTDEHCASLGKLLSEQYEDFRRKLDGTGRTYDHIVQEKALVDIYSSFEQFLSDCLFNLYFYFPKFLGDTVEVSTMDLFIDGNIDLCKKNNVESKVKREIQKHNIKDVLLYIKKEFDMKSLQLDDSIVNELLEIGLIRNLVVHNNGFVNVIHGIQIKKFFPENSQKYPFKEGESVQTRLSDIIDRIKEITGKLCEEMAKIIVGDASRLEKYHQNYISKSKK